MHQDKPKQEVKTLSIRIPLELYLVISQYTLDADFPSLNSAIISLIKSGLSEGEERENIIGRYILNIVPKEELEKLINGN